MIGTGLAEGREVVVRVRAAAPRFAACTAVQRPCSIPDITGELQRCWAAGVWTRAFDAKKQQAARQAITILTQDEAHERLRRAGMR